MDLGLDITRTRGRPAKPVVIVPVRELNLADLGLLETEKGVKAPPIKKIRESHHALARALAAGMKPAEAGMVTGYSPSRISILQADPAFQQLLALYKDEVGEIYAELHGKMAAVAVDAVEELHERLAESPEDITTNQLVEISKTFADRTGYGPQTKNTTVNVNVNLASRLEAGRRRAERGPLVIDQKPEEPIA